MSTATLPGLSCLINRKSLLAAINAVSGVVPTRSPKPILTYVKLSIDAEGHAALHATDLEVAIRASVSVVKSDAPGAVILSPAKLASILGSSRDDELSIETDDSQVIIKGLRSKFVLSTEDPDLFPSWDDNGRLVKLVTLTQAELRRLIRRTFFACDVESTRYALGGCKFEVERNQVKFIGTDGRRLALQSVASERDKEEGIDDPADESDVIPQKALKLIDRNLNDDEASVRLAIVRSQDGTKNKGILIESDTFSVFSRFVDGRFPKYQDVFPDRREVSISLDIASLKSAVEQASIVTSDESRGVDFTFGDGMLTLESQAADVGASKVETPINHDGKTVEITFDPRYLTDALRAIGDSVQEIKAELIDAKHAAVFRTDDGLSYVVMPLTRER